MSLLQTGIPGGMELAVLLLLLVVAVPVYLGYRLLRSRGDGGADGEDQNQGVAEVGGVRVGLTRNLWKLVGLLIVLAFVGRLGSGEPFSGLAGFVGFLLGGFLLVWVPVMIVRLGRAGWALASGAVRS